MFLWDKSIHHIDILVSNVLHLFRSMRDVQLALPGISAQQATAYLCQYKQENDIATVAVFQMHSSNVLAFYFSDPKGSSESESERVLEQGLNFVESMGFLLTDQDIHLLSTPDQESLWDSLPLKSGLLREKESVSLSHEDKPTPKKSDTASGKTSYTKHSTDTVKEVHSGDKKASERTSFEDSLFEELVDEADGQVDDLLAAVEAMRPKRFGLKPGRQSLSASELKLRREQLCHTIGRILASL